MMLFTAVTPEVVTQCTQVAEASVMHISFTLITIMFCIRLVLNEWSKGSNHKHKGGRK